MISGEFGRFDISPLIHHALINTLFMITVNLTGDPASQWCVFSPVYHYKVVDLAGIEPASVQSLVIASFTSLVDCFRRSTSYLILICTVVNQQHICFRLMGGAHVHYQAAHVHERDSLSCQQLCFVRSKGNDVIVAM